jgi:hypothetical protein
MDSSVSWRTSSYSGGSGGNCVEVAADDTSVFVRDTKQHGRGPVSQFTKAGWRAFITQIQLAYRPRAESHMPCSSYRRPTSSSSTSASSALSTALPATHHSAPGRPADRYARVPGP